MTTAFLSLLISGLAGAVIGLLWVADRNGLTDVDATEGCQPRPEAPPSGDEGVRRAA